jgi:flagellar motor switch protein FliM
VERDNPSQNEGEALTDVLLETPVVVRVELGAVSMTAREWARLGPGDIIETGQRIAEPVVLRIAGREVGRGELVNVDGQVGVRIQKLYEAT